MKEPNIISQFKNENPNNSFKIQENKENEKKNEKGFVVFKIDVFLFFHFKKTKEFMFLMLN